MCITLLCNLREDHQLFPKLAVICRLPLCVFPLNIFSIMGSGDHQKKAKINSFYSSHIEKFQKEAFKGHQIEPQDCL